MNRPPLKPFQLFSVALLLGSQLPAVSQQAIVVEEVPAIESTPIAEVVSENVGDLVEVIPAVPVAPALAPTPILEPAVVVASQLQRNPEQDYFERCRQFYKEAEGAQEAELKSRYFERAIPMLSDYIATYPEHGNTERAWYYLAEANYQIGKLPEARKAFQTLIDTYESGQYVAASAYRLAHDSYSNKQYDQAAHYFDIAATHSANDQDKLKSTFYKAQSLTRASKVEESMVVYAQVVSIEGENPYRASASLTLAKLHLKRSEFVESLARFESLLSPAEPGKIAIGVTAEASYYAGVAASALTKTEKAKKYYYMCMLTASERWGGLAQTALMGLRFSEKDYVGVIKLEKSENFKLDGKSDLKQKFIVGKAHYHLRSYSESLAYFDAVEKMPSAAFGKESVEFAFESGYYKLLSYYNLEKVGIADKVDDFLMNYAAGRGKHKFIHQALLMKAEDLYVAKKFKLASAVYFSINPRVIDVRYSEGVMFRRGDCLVKMEEPGKAIDPLTTFITDFPESPTLYEAYLLRASSYTKLDDSANALQDYDHVIQATPKSDYAAVALQRSAQIQLANKEYSDMVTRYEKLVGDHPKLDDKVKANAYYWIGRGYFKAKNYELGIKALDRCREIDADSYKNQVDMLRVIGHFSLRDIDATVKAVADTNRNGLAHKVPASVYRWLGSDFYKREKFPEAVEYLKRGVDPSQPAMTPIPIWRILSKAQLATGLFDAAYLTVNTLLSLEEDKSRVVDALLDKSTILMKLGSSERAKKSADSALEMNPTGTTQAKLLQVVADHYYLTRNYKKAAAHYVLLVDTEELEFHPAVLDRMSICLSKMGDQTESDRYAQILSSSYPKYKSERASSK